MAILLRSTRRPVSATSLPTNPKSEPIQAPQSPQPPPTPGASKPGQPGQPYSLYFWIIQKFRLFGRAKSIQKENGVWGTPRADQPGQASGENVIEKRTATLKIMIVF